MSLEKLLLVHAFLIPCAAVFAATPAYGQEPMFDITISSPAAEFVAGADIPIDVSIVNHIGHTLLFHLRMDPDRAGITVRDDHGALVEPLEKWRKPPEILRWSGEGAEPFKTLKIAHVLNLARWFDLSPGRYFVQLAPEGESFEGDRDRQKSNVLEISIRAK